MATKATYLIWIALCFGFVPGCRAIYKTACLEGGQPAGEDLYNRGLLDNVTSETMYLMKDTGSINCYGVIREWQFFKVGPCEQAVFYVWRLISDDEYLLVGRNEYDPFEHGCLDTEIATFGVRGDEQIPVTPGDIIGWSQQTGGMISTAFDNTTLVQLFLPGDSREFGSAHTFGDSIEMEISLQAVVTRSTLPLFSTLPREQIMAEEYSNKDIYTVVAVHPGNIMPQSKKSAMEDAVEITYNMLAHLDKFSIGASDGKVKTIVDVFYEAGDVYEVPITASAMVMTATSTLTITVTEAQPKLTITGPSDVSISALDKRMDDEIFRVFLDTYTGEKDVKFYFDHSHSHSTNSTGTPPFYIDEDTGIIKCVMDLTKYVHDSSHPSDATFSLEVIATDGVLFNRKRVEVTISHLRQIPSFANLPLTVNVTEEVAAMTEVFKSEITSTYPTERIHFEISSVVPGEYFDSFQIDSQTGRVWIRGGHGLIREENYVLTISGQDTVNATADGQLTIQVDTVNQPPYYEPQFYQANVPEKCDEDVIGECSYFPWKGAGITLAVFDRESNTLECDILWPEFYYHFFNFSEQCNERVLEIIKTVDVDLHPSMQSINLTASVVDSGGLEAIAYIQLTFYDINDHIPQFKPADYAHQLDENTPGGVKLFQVFAEDGDLTSPNNEVRYSIEGVLGNKYFKIDSVSGIVSTKQAVDYETYPSIDFDIKAKDLGTPNKENFTSATITIDDLNDMHPEFECLNRAEDDPYPPEQNCFYNLELRSDTTIGHELVQLVARDNDTITPEVFFFFLKPDSHFMIDHYNGKIESTRKMSDYTKYILYVYAEDHGAPNLYSQIQYVRVDAYPAKWHLIDITLEIPIEQFNATQLRFHEMLRELLGPWHVKIENFKIYKEKTKVTIYALSDISTYAIENMRLQKKFVHRDALLSKLRKNIHGTPSDGLIEHGDEFDPIRVMPTYPNWWIDTMEGIATICALCLLFVLLCVTMALLICWKMGTLCFGKKPSEDEPVKTKRPPTPISDEFQMKLHYGNGAKSIRHRSAACTPEGIENTIEESNGNEEDFKEPPLTRKASLASLTSVDTIHTLVYDRGPKPTKTFHS